MTAEAIARVVSDLRSGRVRYVWGDGADTEMKRVRLELDQLSKPTIDATALYSSLVDNPKPVYLYEDHPCIAPPLECAEIGYVNEHGNVLVMSMMSHDHRVEHVPQTFPETLAATMGWEPAEPVDWDRVRWSMFTWLYVGGRGSNGESIGTVGPMHMWCFAIYEDGSPADLHWVQLVQRYPMEQWDMAHLVLLGALNFLNCRNVELVDPQRPRAERRRLERIGISPHTINVFPVGRFSRSAKAGEPLGVPLSSVRGHFAKYGPAYDRGLLFGKLEGRFWIPQHARGAAEHGESEADYRLMPTA